MMKHLISALSILLISVLFSSCSAIAGIFKAGMSFGIFIVIAVIVMIVVIVVRAGRKK